MYDGYKLIEELDGLNGDALLRRYTWQPESVGMDTPVAVFDAANNATYYYHCDANKNVTELTDASGDVVAHYEYGPFGETLTSTGAYAATNPFRFSGEFFDNETGLVYYNYRYYSPELGRWLSRDPIAEQGGWNLYNMCGNNPVNYWDWLGLVTPKASDAVYLTGGEISGLSLRGSLMRIGANIVEVGSKVASLWDYVRGKFIPSPTDIAKDIAIDAAVDALNNAADKYEEERQAERERRKQEIQNDLCN